MHFGENQLSRSLIGLSPLHTDHPPGFQPWWVRASTQSYLSFTLPMRRSPRFGPAAYDSGALFRLAFATAPPHGLTSPHTATRRLILQKARSHHPCAPKNTDDTAPTACKHTVSGTISQPLTGALFTFPSRYSCTIGHQGVFRLTRWSWQIHTGFLEPRATRDTPQTVEAVSPTRLSRSTATHPRVFDYHNDLSLPGRSADRPKEAPTTPHTQHPPAITRARFSLFRVRSPLLTESLLFSLPTGTEMFHFPASPPTALYIQTAATRHDSGQVSPFGHPRIKAWQAAPRGLTQPPTSFIGS
jgi:hypothetical protein